LFDCISIENSRWGIALVELEQPKLLDRDGVVLVVPIFDHGF